MCGCSCGGAGARTRLVRTLLRAAGATARGERGHCARPGPTGNARSRTAVRRVADVVQTADALACWHRRLVPRPSMLVANSVGCQVAAALVARHANLVHRLVLLGPALTPGASVRRQSGQLLADAFENRPPP
ncbi:serine aminopeptidase domain-containing protein [Streptomyces cyaneofuscatus]|nr:alpha/beta hydrolase [Streptomyces cyaneofuscatus]